MLLARLQLPVLRLALSDESFFASRAHPTRRLIDRLASERGVVDFIDVGLGMHRWPTFNIADMAVSGGAFLLAWVLWGEEQTVLKPEAIQDEQAVAGEAK